MNLNSIINKAVFRLKVITMGNKSFSSDKYWNMRYDHQGNSGLGSYGEIAQNKATWINDNISKFDIESVIEFGSGDGSQLQLYNFKKYLGFDISTEAIMRCKKQYKDDNSKSFMFLNTKLTDFKSGIIQADMALSSEVIFHLVEEDVYEQHLDNLFSVAKNYVCIISTNHNENEGMPAWIKHRKFTDYIDQKYPKWKFIQDPLSSSPTIIELHGRFFHFFKKD